MGEWKRAVKHLKHHTYALYLAYKDPRTPLYARVFVAVVVAYAFSPIDLIPDFIPVLGYLDDLILVPLGIVIALRLIPTDVMADCQQQAQLDLQSDRPFSRVATITIVIIWLVLAILGIVLLRGLLT